MTPQNGWAGLGMPDQNAPTDLLQNPALARLASVGKHALESGKISPEEAASHAQYLGLSMEPSRAPAGALAMGNGPLPGQPPVAAIGQLSPQDTPADAAPDDSGDDPSSVAQLPSEKPGAYFKRQMILSQEDKTKSQQNKYMAPDDVKAAMDVVRGTPEFQDMRQGEGSMQDLLSMTAKSQQAMAEANPSWVKPLLALVDSQTGSKLMAGYTPPASPTEMNSQLLKYADEIQKRKADLVKGLSTGLTAQKNGGFQVVTTTQGSKDTGAQGEGSPSGAGGLSTQRRNALIARSGEAFDKDTMLTRFAKTQTALDRAQGMLSSKVPITSTDLQALQQDLLTAFTQDGVVTEGKAQREILEPFASIVNRIVSKGDRIEDIRKDTPDLIQHLQDRLSLLKGDYNKASNARVNELATNWKDVPDDLVQSTVTRKADMLHQKFSAPVRKSAPAAPSKPASITQNGHTYTLNPTTGEYE